MEYDRISKDYYNLKEQRENENKEKEEYLNQLNEIK